MRHAVFFAPVADYACETATWAIHAWPALPDTDAVFEIVTTRPVSYTHLTLPTILLV